jgi:hypothetical protein
MRNQGRCRLLPGFYNRVIANRLFSGYEYPVTDAKHYRYHSRKVKRTAPTGSIDQKTG